jgi:hypothetical protein
MSQYRFPGNAFFVLPVSMWVHRESRNETLKNYCIFEGPLIHGRKEPMPICFNPAKDKIYLPFDQMFPGNMYGNWSTFENYLSTLTLQASRHMEKIRQVEISGARISQRDCRISELFSLVTSEGGAPVQCFAEAYNSALFHFPGLQKILLGFEVNNKQDMSDIARSVTAFVEVHRRSFMAAKRLRSSLVWLSVLLLVFGRRGATGLLGTISIIHPQGICPSQFRRMSKHAILITIPGNISILIQN